MSPALFLMDALAPCDSKSEHEHSGKKKRCWSMKQGAWGSRTHLADQVIAKLAVAVTVPIVRDGEQKRFLSRVLGKRCC